jgi:hypothetical protein
VPQMSVVPAPHTQSHPFVWFPLAKQRHAIAPQDRNVPQGAPMKLLCLAVPSSAPDAFGVTPSVSSPVPARPCGVPAGVMTWDDETMSRALPPPRWRGLEEPHQSRHTTRSSSTSMAIEPEVHPVELNTVYLSGMAGPLWV